MRKISVYSGKGGVGKSTISVMLAGWYVSQGLKVCVVDCDEQKTMCDIYQNHLGFDVRTSEPVQGYDMVILDHHPAHKSIRLADLVISPIRPSLFDLNSYKRSRAFIGGRKNIVVLTQWQENPDDRAFKIGLQKLCGQNDIKCNTIKLRSIYKKTTNNGQTIYDIKKSRYGVREARNEIQLLAGVIDDQFK